MKRIAVFASGNGSNFEALVTSNLKAEIGLLVCDNPDAYVIERASKAGIESFVFIPKTFSSKEAFEESIIERLRDASIDFIVLAGYMRLIGPTLLQAFEGRIVNIHPSLLPAFPGKDAVGQALQAGVKETGVTIHYVDAGMDTGPIIARQSIEIYENETRESLEGRIHHIEHRFYPETINQLLTARGVKS